MAVKISQMTAAATLTGNEQIEASQLSTSVTITATTISALASDNSYNDSGAGFVAAGFAVGDTVQVSGFTGDTANNINSGTITALTTSKMTIGGTDGDVIVDDSAGESVTITKRQTVRTTAQDIADLGGGGGGSSAVGDLLDYTFVRKTADETVTSSTTFQDDDHLTFSIGAGETWLVEYSLYVDGATGGDLKAAINVPSGATGWLGGIRYDLGATASPATVLMSITTDLTDTGFRNAGTVGSSSPSLVLLRAMIVNSSNAGSVVLRWAQSTSSGTATAIRANSYLEARRVA